MKALRGLTGLPGCRSCRYVSCLPGFSGASVPPTPPSTTTASKRSMTTSSPPFSAIMRSDNPHKILGVNFGASKEEVKRSYRELAKRWHPDVNKTDEAESVFRRISNAYRKLLSISPDESSSSSSTSNSSRSMWTWSPKFRRNRHQFDDEWTSQDSKMAHQAKRSWFETVKAESQKQANRPTAEDMNHLFLSLVPPERMSTQELRNLCERLDLPKNRRRTELVSNVRIFMAKQQKRRGSTKDGTRNHPNQDDDNFKFTGKEEQLPEDDMGIDGTDHAFRRWERRKA